MAPFPHLAIYIAMVLIGWIFSVARAQVPSEGAHVSQTSPLPIEISDVYRSTLKFGTPSPLYRYLASRDGEVPKDEELLRALESAKIATPEDAVKQVATMEVATEKEVDAQRARLRVVALIELAADRAPFGAKGNYVWIVRRATKGMKTVNQYWVNAKDGKVLEAFKLPDPKLALQLPALEEEEIAMAWRFVWPNESFSELESYLLFGNLSYQFAREKLNATKDGKPQGSLQSELALTKVKNAGDVSLAAMLYLKQNGFPVLASTTVGNEELIRTAVDLPGFARKNDLIWIAYHQPIYGVVGHEIWINARTGETRLLPEEGMIIPTAK